MWPTRLVVALVILLLPGVMLAPVWRLAGLGASEDDVLYYFPARVFFHDTIATGDWPWWNPWTGLGRPFMADPQSAMWYPTTWLFAVLDPLRAYPASLWLHFSLAMWGMYRLCRAQGLNRWGALFGGIAFGFCGFLLAHRAHFTMQHAAAWTPWVFWRFQRFVLAQPRASRAAGALVPATADTGVGRYISLWRHRVRFAEAAGVLALQSYAGHFQIVALTATGALVWALAHLPPGATHRLRGVFVLASRWLVACVFAAGLFALQLMPTLAYLRVCTRGERTFLDFVENSWHPASVVSFVAPMLYGQRTPNFFPHTYWGPSHQVEQLAYAGIVPLLLAAMALRPGWRFDAKRRPWILLVIFSVLLALGQFGPLCPILYWIPGSSLFRCPARAMLLVNLAIAALAARSLNELFAPLNPERARFRAALIELTGRPLLRALIAVGVALVLALLVVPFVSPAKAAVGWRALRPWNPAVLVALAAVLVSLLSIGVAVRRWRNRAWLALPVLVTAVELGVIGWAIDVPAGVTSPAALLAPRAPADWMNELRDSGERLWVVTQRIDGKPGEYIDSLDKVAANTNILRGIPTLSDYGPLQPRSYVYRFGMQPWGESWKPLELLADMRWSRLYNIGWVLLCEPDWPAPAGFELAQVLTVGRLYRASAASGLVLLEQAGQSAAVQWARPGSNELRANVDTWPPQRRGEAQVSADPPRIVFSELALPGWSATVNGTPAPIERVDGTLLGVRLKPATATEVTFRYSPPGLAAGIAVTATTVVSVLLLLFGGVFVRSVRRAKGMHTRVM
jgi:hypothetical protein